MLQLDNKTPFAASISPMPNEHGLDCVYVMLKGTFIMGQKWMLSDDQLAPQEADEYYGEPLSSSLKAASDYHIGKAGTDVVVLGNAMAPDQRKVAALDVSVNVHNKAKQVRVFGDRTWDSGVPSSPELFETMPIVYERAYGGCRIDEAGTVLEAETRNPVGIGFLGKRSEGELNGHFVPNIEDPHAPIHSPKDRPPVAGFGYIAPNWEPRVAFAGTYDEVWQESRAPFLPIDFSRKFLNAAHPDLVFDGFLSGGEPVSIANMHPAGPLNFNLPLVNVKTRARIGRDLHDVKMNLETVELRPNKAQVSLAWRGQISCEKKLSSVSEIQISLSR